MDDSAVEVREESWSNRLTSSVQGILVGFLLIGGGIYLLQWNEGKFVSRYRGIQEGRGDVIDVDPFGSINSGNDGKLIHFTGKTSVNSNVTDDLFGVTSNVDKAIKLRRSVEMYQWVQKKKKTTQKKGTKTVTKIEHTYSKKWSGDLKSSAEFYTPKGHENPIDFPFKSRTFTASDVDVGHIKISPDMISKFYWFSKLPVYTKSIPNSTIKADLQDFDGIFFSPSNFSAVKGTPMNPIVGDTKVAFDVVLESEVSILAKQAKQTIAPYTASNGELFFLYMKGSHTADEMFTQAEKDNALMTWLLRGGGFLTLFLGFKLIAEPLAVVVDCIPFLGNLVEAGINILAAILAFAISVIVIAIAWVLYRPMFALILVLITVAVVTAGTIFAKKSKKEKNASSSNSEYSGSYQKVVI